MRFNICAEHTWINHFDCQVLPWFGLADKIWVLKLKLNFKSSFHERDCSPIENYIILCLSFQVYNTKFHRRWINKGWFVRWNHHIHTKLHCHLSTWSDFAYNCLNLLLFINLNPWINKQQRQSLFYDLILTFINC